MDRRLQPTSAAHDDSLARRVLALEQRLDLQGARPRWQSQRYDNPPCCAADPGLLLLGVGPGDVDLSYGATYTFTAPGTASLIEFSGDAPADDGRGWGLEITISHNGTPFAVGTLTGAAATDSAAVSEVFAATDIITFEITDKSTGDAIAIAVDVTLDGTQEAFVGWDPPA